MQRVKYNLGTIDDYVLIAENVKRKIDNELEDIFIDVKDAKESGKDPKEEVADALDELFDDDEIDVEKLKQVAAQLEESHVINENAALNERRLLTETPAILVLFGCVLAAPKLVSLFVELVAKIKGVHKEVHGSHTKYDDAFLNSIEQGAHKVHGWFLGASGGLVDGAYRAFMMMTLRFGKAKKGMPKDVKKQWAEKTLMLIIAIMFVSSGCGAAAAAAKAKAGAGGTIATLGNGLLAVIESTAATVKGIELAEFGAPIAKDAAPVVFNALSSAGPMLSLLKNVFTP